MSRAVVLLSGGLDSATVLAIVKADGFDPYPLSFSYGQRHSTELDCARWQAREYPHKIVTLDLRQFGGSALTDQIDVPKSESAEDVLASKDVPVTYVPGRNLILLSYALAYAELVEADDIFVGVNALDYSGYPDCRPAFIAAMNAVVAVATKRAVTVQAPLIRAPLIEMTKAQIIEKGLQLGVDYAHTHSCYDPQPLTSPPLVDASFYAACGRCDSCLLRLKGFEEAGTTDPAVYAEHHSL